MRTKIPNQSMSIGVLMSEQVPEIIPLAEAIARVQAEPVPYALLFERGGLAVELFIPHGKACNRRTNKTSYI